MKKKLIITSILLLLGLELHALTFRSPLVSSETETTKGPGSYGRNKSDVRYHVGWKYGARRARWHKADQSRWLRRNNGRTKIASKQSAVEKKSL